MTATPAAPAAPAATPPASATPSAAAPATLNLRTLLEQILAGGASDLHITANSPPKLRIDGEMETSQKITQQLGPKETLMLAYSVLTENQKKKFETEDELDFSFGISGLARFRGNVFKQRGCVAMVVRVIPFKIKTFDDLHLPKILADLSDRPRGLVL